MSPIMDCYHLMHLWKNPISEFETTFWGKSYIVIVKAIAHYMQKFYKCHSPKSRKYLFIGNILPLVASWDLLTGPLALSGSPGEQTFSVPAHPCAV